MTWSKRQIIGAAFEEIGLGAYAYDLQADELQSALLRLNALLAEWSGSGANTGYPSNNTPGSDDLDADSNLPPDAVRGAICGLAVDLAPGYGKQVSPTTLTAAKAGKTLMQSKTATILKKVPNWQAAPAGAGHKRRWVNSLSEPDTEQLPGEAQ